MYRSDGSTLCWGGSEDIGEMSGRVENPYLSRGSARGQFETKLALQGSDGELKLVTCIFLRYDI